MSISYGGDKITSTDGGSLSPLSANKEYDNERN